MFFFGFFLMFFAKKSVWTTLQYIIIQVQIIFYCYHFKVLSCCACRSIFLVCVSFPVFVFFYNIDLFTIQCYAVKIKNEKILTWTHFIVWVAAGGAFTPLQKYTK